MFLDKIIAAKWEELEERQKTDPLPKLMPVITERPLPLDLASTLVGASPRLIAEVKRASPSKGVLCPNLDAVELAGTYARCGAAAISVLTESRYFWGSRQDLEAVRSSLPHIPILRKDFIINPYQVLESRALGADAILLIAAILNDDELEKLLMLSHTLGMQCLVEVHNRKELEMALAHDIKIIGINNRDLDTLKVDINVTRKLRPLIPPGRIVVSESGIKGPGDIRKLREWRVDAVLIGEALVTAGDVTAKIKELF